jgi:hypothetical protein
MFCETQWSGLSPSWYRTDGQAAPRGQSRRGVWRFETDTIVENLHLYLTMIEMECGTQLTKNFGVIDKPVSIALPKEMALQFHENFKEQMWIDINRVKYHTWFFEI